MTSVELTGFDLKDRDVTIKSEPVDDLYKKSLALSDEKCSGTLFGDVDIIKQELPVFTQNRNSDASILSNKKSSTPNYEECSRTISENLIEIKQEPPDFALDGNAAEHEDSKTYVEELIAVFPALVKQESVIDPLYTGDLDNNGVIDVENSHIEKITDLSVSGDDELTELPSSSGYIEANESFNALSILDQHEKNCYQCFHCRYRGRDKIRLMKHIQNIHLGMKRYHCNICRNNYSDRSGLKRHIVAIHQGLKPYSCDVCNFRTGHLGAISRHRMTHSGKELFTCSICYKNISDKRTLRKHIQVIHQGIKPYVCNLCNYRSGYLSGMKRHLITHHLNVVPYVCEKCSYKTSRYNDMLKHMKSVHEMQKPYTCNVCRNRFSEVGGLVKHLKAVHLGLKPYSCPHCDYCSSQNQHIKVHIDSVHKNLRIFKCYLCNYCASVKSTLKRHILNKHIATILDYTQNSIDPY